MKLKDLQLNCNLTNASFHAILLVYNFQKGGYMGRSVDYLNNAKVVIYFPTPEAYDEDGQYNEDIGQMNWDDLIYSLEAEIQAKLPSYEIEKGKWDGRETKIILSNRLCNIGISEYCGLVSLSVAPKDIDYGYSDQAYHEHFAIRHAEQIENTLQRIVDDVTGDNRLKKMGTFSNGEAIFEKAGETICHNQWGINNLGKLKG